MGSTRNGGGGAQERDGRALDSSPHRDRERAVKEEVAKSFRNPSGKETPAEKTIGVVRQFEIRNSVNHKKDWK